MNDDILVLRGNEVDSLLAGREIELIDAVRGAYEAHANGKTSLPHSTFLNFPDDRTNRIIALPAYLGNGAGVAGIKWVSSFPGNLNSGMERASAVLILNSSTTGRPEAIIEGSIISAKRTAASAALAAQTLLTDTHVDCVGVIGCGLINYEIARFLLVVCPAIRRLVAHDLNPERAGQFKRICQGMVDDVEIVNDPGSVLGRCPLISFATTASTPHIVDLAQCAPGSTVLHISLRDLTPELILSCDNVVDDTGHVARAGTSIHLTAQLVGNTDFVRCSLGQILTGEAVARVDARAITVFSPFGLGILDLAAGRLVCDLAARENVGSRLQSFLPMPWTDRTSKAIDARTKSSAS